MATAGDAKRNLEAILPRLREKWIEWRASRAVSGPDPEAGEQ